jgi:K+-sensing histidine kinase KdpD
MAHLVDPSMTLSERLSALEELALDHPGGSRFLEEVRALRAVVVRYEKERLSLHGEMAAREEDVHALRDALAQARRRSAEAASLYVAVHRLHSTLHRGQVLQALEEILASLVGCEEMVVYERRGASALLPVATVGLPPGTAVPLREATDVVEQVLCTGDMWIGDGSGALLLGRPVTACIPLNVDGEITGIIVLFRLLSHKVALEPADIELLEVLSQHVGTALYATRAPGRVRGARS